MATIAKDLLVSGAVAGIFGRAITKNELDYLKSADNVLEKAFELAQNEFSNIYGAH